MSMLGTVFCMGKHEQWEFQQGDHNGGLQLWEGLRQGHHTTSQGQGMNGLREADTDTDYFIISILRNEEPVCMRHISQ